MTTLNGKSAFPENHPLALGCAGGSRHGETIHFLDKADLILGLGTSFTHSEYITPFPTGGRTFLQLTNWEGDVSKDYPVDLGVIGDAKAGAIYVVDRGYVDFARLYVLHQAGAFFVTRAKSNIDAHRVYSAPTDRSTGIICDQTISLDGFYTRQDYPNFCGASASRTPSPARRWSSSPTTSRFGRHHLRALQKPLQVELFFKWIKQHLRIKQFLRHVGERGEDADLDCRLGLRPRRHRQEAPRPGRLALHFVTDPLGDPLRENAHTSSLAGDENRCNASQITNQLNLFDFNRTLVCPVFSGTALALGETLPLIGKLLGHRWHRTTAGYAHLADRASC